MWQIKDKTGSKIKCTVKAVEYNGTWMGECYLTVTIESPAPISFEIGDFIEYRGERFEINYDPTEIKRANKEDVGDAFKYEQVKFNSLADELTRCDFLDYVLEDNQLHYTGLPTFSFFAASIKDLADRIQVNLDRLYKDEKKWTVEVHPEYVNKTDVNIQVDKIKVWGALELVNKSFGANFIIRGRKIIIGTAGLPISNIFKYGKNQGLATIKRQAESDQQIVTRLRVYGSTRNMPLRYYNKLVKDNGEAFIPNNMAVNFLMLPEFPEQTQDPYIDSANINTLGVREGSVFFDGSNSELEEIFPSIEGMTAQNLIDAGIPTTASGNLDEVEGAEQANDDGLWENKEETDVPNFKIYLKDIGFNINDYLTTESAVISMKSGMLGGREFTITKCEKTNDGYTLICQRVYDSDLRLYFPYKDYNIKKGDRFVLLHIEMPDVYIKAASQRLKMAGTEYLSKNDYSRYSYSPEIDEIFMARQHDRAIESEGLEKSIHDTIKEGDLLIFKDEDLLLDNASIIIDNLQIKEGDEKVPTYKITLRNEKTVGTIQRLQNQIDSIVNGYYKGQGSGGYTSAQIRDLISLFGSELFLSKLRPDVAREVIDFVKGWEVGEWEPDAAGAKAWIDANGDANIEADILRIRKRAFFKSLVVAETEYIGGELALTPGGGIECTDVSAVPQGWRCWYMCKDTDGKRIHCKLKTGDFAKCQTFNLGAPEADGSYSDVANTYYWREVVAVGNPSNPDDVRTDEQGREYSYIVLSNEPGHYDPASVSEPHAGDHIVHLGNADDPLRQTAIIISTTATTAPSIVMYTGINTFALANRAIITLGRDEQGNAWLRLGAKGAKHYLNYNQATGLDVCGNLHVSSGQSVEELLGDKEGNYRLDLNPAAMAVQCDAEGNITAEIKDMPVLTMQAYLGNAEIDKYNATTKKGVSYHLEATAGVTFYNDYTIPDNQVRMRRETGMSADTALVTVTAKVYNGGDDPAMILTNRATLYKVRPGVGGAPGDPGLRLVLSQSAMAVPCDAAGSPLAGTLPIEITAALYRGNEAVAPSALKLSNIEGFGTDGIGVDSNVIRISKILNRVNKATVTATYGEYSAQATLSVTKVLNGAPGDPGQAAVVYTIEPTAAIVKRGALGLADPARVGVHVYRTTGNSPRQELSADDFKNEKFTVEYRKNTALLNQTLAYGQSVTVAKDDKELIFGLYKDNALLAEVRVPVVEDMTDYEVGGVNLIHNTNQGAKGWERSTYSYYRSSGSTVGWNNSDLFVLTTDGKDVVATNGYKYPYKSKLDDNKQTHSYEPEEVTYQLKFATGLASFEGKYYTLSLDLPLRYKCAVADTMELRIGFGSNYSSVKTYHSETLPVQATLGDATIHVSATFKPSLGDSAENLFIYLVIKNPAAVVGGVAQSILDYIRVRNVMLERGTVATLWTPAPTDIDYLTSAFSESTDINGGVVMTTRVRVGCTVNGKWTEYGGLNGAVTDVSGNIVSNAPIVYAGGEMIDAAKEPNNTSRATSMIRVDGTAYFANNTVRMSENEMEVGDFILLRDDGLHMIDPDTQSERLWITNGSVGDLANLGSLVGVSNTAVIRGTATMYIHRATGVSTQPGKPAYQPGTYLQKLDSNIILNLNSSNAIADSGALKVAVGLSFTPTGHTSGYMMCVHLAARLMCSNDGYSSWMQVGSAQTFTINGNANSSTKTHTFNFAAALTKGRYYRIEIFCPQNDAPGEDYTHNSQLTATIAIGAQTITPTQQRTILGKDGLATAWGETALLVKDVKDGEDGEVTLVQGKASVKVAKSEVDINLPNSVRFHFKGDGLWVTHPDIEAGKERQLRFDKLRTAGFFNWFPD